MTTLSPLILEPTQKIVTNRVVNHWDNLPQTQGVVSAKTVDAFNKQNRLLTGKNSMLLY